VDVAACIAAVVTSLSRARDRVLVGIDGPDSAGKSTLAGRLAGSLAVPVLRASIDGFHLPREARYWPGGTVRRRQLDGTIGRQAVIGGLGTLLRRPVNDLGGGARSLL
jgi:pantothenate kinase-related protein Tda10